MRSGNYSQALLLVTTRVANVIAQDAGIQLTAPQLAPAPVEEPSRGMSAGGIILLIVIVTHRSRHSASQLAFLDFVFRNVWRRRWI